MEDFSQLISSLLPAVGTAAGTALGGPLGGMAGGAIGKMASGAISGDNKSMTQQAGQSGMAMGIGQMLSGLSSKKSAEGYFPSYQDPKQMALLAEIGQKKKSLETGADFAEALRGINQAQGATQAGIIKATGGDVGGTIQGLLQSERTTANARNQAYAQGAGQQMAYNSLYSNLLNNIEARDLQLRMQQSQQKMAEWAQSMKEGRQNFLAGMANSMAPPDINPEGQNYQDLLSSISFSAPTTQAPGENDVIVDAAPQFNFENVDLKNNYGLDPSFYGMNF